MKALDLIPVPSALGAPDPGVAQGPAALRHAGLQTALHRCGRAAEWNAPVAVPEGERWTALAQLCEDLAHRVEASLAAGRQPLVLGGDHSIAAGTWRGVAQARTDKPIGLLWLDAHLDAHTREDSTSANPHGMPVALLLGDGDPRLARPWLSPSHLCLVGARSWELPERVRLERFGVRIFDQADIRRRGLGPVLAEALAIVSEGTAGFGISLDLDVFDPADAPGVNSPAADGFPVADWLQHLRGLAARDDCLAVEITECDGGKDEHGSTAALACCVAETLYTPSPERLMALEAAHGARNYAPLPVVLVKGQGCTVWDADGHEYLDMMSAYSALSFGHSHPRLLAALARQAEQLAVTSRAFHNALLPAFLRRLTELTGYEKALPVNTGVEAVETALKAARKWGYRVKGIAPDRAEIIACDGNFHGRTIAAVSLSSEPQYRDGFGPFPGGMKRVPYGDAAALEAAICPHTAAFLVEPIQGEGGIVVPSAGYLAACAAICKRHGVLLIADEVQTGLGRCGHLLASHGEGVRPDGVILGKALGGGLYPVSAFIADTAVMDVFCPGHHGSTFGGNALAAAVGLEALDLLVELDLPGRAARLGERFMARLQAIRSPLIRQVRGRGLLIGIDLDPSRCDGHEVALALLRAGILTKETHHTVIRLAPPLTIEEAQLEWAAERIEETLSKLES